MTRSLELLDRVVGSAMKWFCRLCFIALTCVVSGVVLIRFWPIAKLSWSDEVIELMVAWIIFIGAADLWRSKSHFRIDAILHMVEKLKFGWIYSILIEITSAVFIVLFTYYSFKLTIAATDVSPILSLPRPLWYAVMPISGVIMVGYSIATITEMAMRPFTDGRQGEMKAPPGHEAARQ